MPPVALQPGVHRRRTGQTAKRDVIWSFAIFCVSFLFLFLGMTRSLSIYDEGITLTAAMRIMAGQVPHRDFYFIYGPAQPYILAGLFKLFGPSVLLARLVDVATKAAISTAVYVIARRHCNRTIAIAAACICALWAFGLGSYDSAMHPVTLLLLCSTALLLPIFTRQLTPPCLFAIGLLTGLTVLFRYDMGLVLLAIHLIMILTASLFTPAPTPRWRAVLRTAVSYLFGFAILVIPVAAAFTIAGAWRDLYFDIVAFPGKYYRAARHLPFPRIYLGTVDDVAVYLLPLIFLLSIVAGISYRRPAAMRDSQVSWKPCLFSFVLLSALMYLKGVVRISVVQVYPALPLSMLLLAVLYQHRSGFYLPLRLLTIVSALIACIAPLSSAHHEFRTLRNNKDSVLGRLLTPATQAPFPPDRSWCSQSNPLTHDFCFVPDPDHIRTIEFIDAHTTPSDTLFVGLSHHDRIFINDNLTYFATQRLPATKWSHFDPDLQTSAPIQQEIMRDLDQNRPSFIVLDSEFDQVREPNDSSKSSGIFLLDAYIHQHYRLTKTFGEMSILQRIA